MLQVRRSPRRSDAPVGRNRLPDALLHFGRDVTELDDPDIRCSERIRSGDLSALGELYDRYASEALALALRIVADRSEAEDVVHDAFVAFWRAIDRYDPRRGGVRPWLMTLVRNRAIDRLRGRSANDSTPLDEGLPVSGSNPTWEATLRRLSVAEVRAALDQLPPEQRQAIELAYFGGYTYREVARLTGVPEGTTNGRLRLGLAKLRNLLMSGVSGPEAGPAARSGALPDEGPSR